jgi:hypothetical protein
MSYHSEAELIWWNLDSLTLCLVSFLLWAIPYMSLDILFCHLQITFSATFSDSHELGALSSFYLQVNPLLEPSLSPSCAWGQSSGFHLDCHIFSLSSDIWLLLIGSGIDKVCLYMHLDIINVHKITTVKENSHVVKEKTPGRKQTHVFNCQSTTPMEGSCV